MEEQRSSMIAGEMGIGSNAFVEFRVSSHDGFQRLRAVFVALQEAKASDEWQSDEYWLKYFEEGEEAAFWWPSETELEEWGQRWFSTPAPERLSDPSLKHPWTLGSMIEAFKNIECELTDCRLVSDDTARLEFTPHAHPYGGTGCIEALIHAFGFSILKTNEP